MTSNSDFGYGAKAPFDTQVVMHCAAHQIVHPSPHFRAIAVSRIWASKFCFQFIRKKTLELSIFLTSKDISSWFLHSKKGVVFRIHLMTLGLNWHSYLWIRPWWYDIPVSSRVIYISFYFLFLFFCYPFKKFLTSI